MASFYVIVQHNQIVGLQSVSLSNAVPTAKDVTVYQIDIQENQIVGLNRISEFLTHNVHPIISQKGAVGPSECVKNITCTLLHSLDLIKHYKTITPEIVSKVITESFNFVGEQNAKGAPRYATTVRDCCTRRIGIRTKSELSSLVYEYLTGENTCLKDILFDKYQKGTTEDIKALDQLFSKFQL